MTFAFDRDVALPLPSGSAPARLWATERATSAPAVLFLHGLSASKESHAKEGRSLAEAGFAAYLPDAPHHGARRSPLLDAMDRASGTEADRLLVRLVEDAADEVPAMVSHLLSLGHPRVAIAGISYGAYVALTAGAREPRLAAVVSLLGSPDWTPRDGVTPPDLREAVARAPVHFAVRFPPRPLLLINGALDENVRPEPARRFAQALRPLYAAAPQNLVHREYPHAGHFPGERDWDDLWMTTVAFLKRAMFPSGSTPPRG